jgi:hypothetical protein
MVLLLLALGNRCRDERDAGPSWTSRIGAFRRGRGAALCSTYNDTAFLSALPETHASVRPARALGLAFPAAAPGRMRTPRATAHPLIE